MIPKTYQLLERCVQEGIERGAQRYNKRFDQPINTPLELQSHQVDAIMLELSEWFTFTDTDLGVIP
jgi:hypothetical protein